MREDDMIDELIVERDALLLKLDSAEKMLTAIANRFAKANMWIPAIKLGEPGYSTADGEFIAESVVLSGLANEEPK